MKDSDIQFLINSIRSVLTPDLLKPQYRKINENNPFYGYCYIASEALYHLTEKRLKSMQAKDDSGISHWWLVSDDGIIYDPTKDQYSLVGKIPPYENGTHRNFLTREPSKRAKIIMNRMNRND